MSSDGIFSRVARTYDIARMLITFGRDNAWKRQALSSLPVARRHLDLGTGTGGMLRAIESQPSLQIGIDRELVMVIRARRDCHKSVAWVIGDVEQLPFRGGNFDVVTGSFLLRYVNTYAVINQVRHVLAERGTVLWYDACRPENRILRSAAWLYLFTATTLVGVILAFSPRHFWHLWQTLGRFDPEQVAKQLQGAEFVEVRTDGVAGGIIRWLTARRA